MKLPKRSAFIDHRNNAKKRGIAFTFTYESWVSWWEQNLGPDWLRLRGCKSDQFVMARSGDKGPYAPSNVMCITARENNCDQAKNGLAGFKKGGPYQGRPHKDGRKISPDQARAIYLEEGTQRSLALKYGVSERLVRLIKNKQVWQSVTALL